MDILSIIIEQLLQMFIVVLFVFLLAKKEILNETTQQEIARMLTKFVVPLTLVLAFQQPFDSNQLIGLAWAFIGSILIFFRAFFGLILAFKMREKLIALRLFSQTLSLLVFQLYFPF